MSELVTNTTKQLVTTKTMGLTSGKIHPVVHFL